MPLSVPEIVKARHRDKVFMAALAVYLGAYVPRLLDEEKQKRIRAQMDAMLAQYDLAWWSAMAWYGKAAFFAAAMARLDIDPLPGLKWAEFYDPHAAQPGSAWMGWWPLKPDPLPLILAQHFHPYHASTEDARKVLRLAGYDIPERDPVIP